MAHDIEFALITTANGLTIAVPLILATAAIMSRLRKTEELTGIGLGRFFEAMAEERGEVAPSYASGQSAEALA
jgi:biopolymer transport protein ExbB/TolQ